MKLIIAMFPLELRCPTLWLGNAIAGPALGKSWSLPQKALSALFTDSVRQGGSHPHKEKGGGRSSVMKENLVPGLRSNMINMNIPGYFIVGKPNHQEEAGLDVSTVCSLFLL